VRANLTTGEVTTSYYLGGRLIAQRVDTTLNYLHQDHLTGTSVVSDSGGTLVSSIKYFPFGSTRSGSVPTDKKFTGQRLDGTGLYYYGARYYDAEIGRFISADTILPDFSNPQSLNRYSYCLNNPLKYIDPTGSWPEWLDTAVSWVADTAQQVGEHVVAGAQWVGGQIVEKAKWVGGQVVEKAKWVKNTVVEGILSAIGIEEIRTYYNPLLGDEPVTVVEAKDSGLNLVNKILDIFGETIRAVAVGGPVGVLSRSGPDETTLTHECQHIKEQRESGWLSWHGRYLYDYGIGFLRWGSHGEAYRYHPAEYRAREAAGQNQPATPPTWAEWWPWAQNSWWKRHPEP
jgi:RHS repeat-associated protein